MIGFTCKYAPAELLAGFGAETGLLNLEAENFDYAQDLTHMNMCSHIKALLEEVHREGIRELLLVDCCDSMRRAADILKDKLDFCFLLDLPHNDDACARRHFAEELMRLAQEYQTYSGKTFDYGRFRGAFTGEDRDVSRDFIAVMGARMGTRQFENLSKAVPMRLEDFTCNSSRSMSPPPAAPADTTDGAHTKYAPDRAAAPGGQDADPRYAEGSAAGADANMDSLMEWYAGELLAQIPCMRMADIKRRREITESPNLRGIIYHTVKFCDYYGFECEMIRRSVSVPVIKIETDFTMQSLGQLSTRIGGFLESMGIGKEAIVAGEGRYYAGIDSGSTTTNVAVLDRQGKLVDYAIVRTGAKAQRGAQKALDALQIPAEEIAVIVATGYGRQNIDFADACITEITCHAKGAWHLAPGIRTIIDIGGQDSKVILLDDSGNVANFAMNDKCAAGTGRFLENMAKVLETDLDGMSRAGLSWEEDLTISSMCTVFAESEVVSLIADNKAVSDIVHGLNKSVASKTMNLVNRVKGRGRYMMTGGGARNRGVVGCLEALVGEKISVPEIPDLCGAIGAALFALEAAEQKGRDS